MSGIIEALGILPTSGVDITSGLLRHFKMNDDAATTAVVDATGTANGIASANTDTFNTTGKVNGALEFDGAAHIIDTSSDMIADSAATITAWIYPTGWGEGTFGRIVDNTDDGTAGLAFRITDATDSLRFGSDGGTTNVDSATNSIVLNTWTHVAVTRTVAGVANFYVNGALNGTADQPSGTPEAGTGNVKIGNRTAGDYTFAGKIDDLRVYNKVLTTAQISAIYAGGAGTEL